MSTFNKTIHEMNLLMQQYPVPIYMYMYMFMYVCMKILY